MLDNLSKAEYEELRSLILGLEAHELEKLWKWLKEPDALAEDISDIIPVSIKQMINKGVISVDSVLSLVEEAIEKSIMEHPGRMANALYPIMMPAIRKAVAEDIKKMIESVNGTLEKSFSFKRMGWRLRALFSHRKYAEIVLSHAYIYRVSQVFLIHRPSGLLLQHAVDEKEEFKDPDMVSAMLTAIKDFVKDSFSVSDEQEIQSIEVGKYMLWVEQGPYAILAGIVEGNPPDHLRELFKQALENIHIQFNKTLVRFDGDTDEFENNDQHIRLCLQSQAKSKKKRPPYILIFLFLVLLGAIGYWIYLGIEENQRWKALTEEVQSKPGIVLIEKGKSGGKYFMKGLRDPLAVNPPAFYSKYGFDSGSVKSKWQYYYALDSAFVLQRITKLIDPPESVKLSYRNGTLYLQGSASGDWLKQAIDRSLNTWGVSEVNTGGMNVSRDKRIQDLIRSIESKSFVFPFTEIELNREQQVLFDTLSKEMNELLELIPQKMEARIHILGHTTREGNVEGNKKYIDRRARYIQNLLLQNNIPGYNTEVNIYIYDSEEVGEGIRARSVTFDVDLRDKP